MSEETASNIETVYVQLLDEGTIVFRPTKGIRLEESIYKILPTKNYDPEDERWEFPPESVVKCLVRELDGKESLVAVLKVPVP